MKRFSLLFASFLLFISQSVFAGPIGPIATEKRGGKVSMGIGYAQTSSKWEAIDRGPERFKLKQNQLFAELGLGLGGLWEINLRGGVADLSLDIPNGSPFSFGMTEAKAKAEDTYRTFGALGVKGNLYSGTSLTIGPFFQGNYYSTYTDRAPGSAIDVNTGLLVKGFETIHLNKWWEVRTGLLMQGIVEGAVLYGGPFYYRGEANARQNFNGTLLEELTLKEQGTFGALLGVRWPMTRNLSFDIEGQLRSATDIDATLHYHF